VASNAVPGFLPSRHGFRFANHWPTGPARTWNLGLVQVGLGDVGRGLCGGMAYAARDRFEREEAAPADVEPPAPGSQLFSEIVDRQLSSFGRLWTVPLRFWLAALGSERSRWRETVRRAWPAIRAEIDAGQPSMIGLVRSATVNPLALDLGHQVVGYRYESSPATIAIGVYDPNHPGDDSVEIVIERTDAGGLQLAQSTGEPVLGLLHLPWREAGARPDAAPHQEDPASEA
jgi:hypothetical protein